MGRLLRLAPACVLALAACQHVPYTGRSLLLLVSEGEELQVGESEYRRALSLSKLSSDPEANALLRRVGQRLAQAADRPDFKWEFSLLDAPETANALCFPGGKVAVYSGLLPLTQDEAGLAVVLGHEISHALARHGAERLSQGLPYSRKQQENEADRIGLILMAKAGYDPSAAVGFWRRMAARSIGRGASHPSDSQRVKAIEDELPEARNYFFTAHPWGAPAQGPKL